MQEAEVLGNKDKQRLLECQKLALVVDLDQTLIHTSMDPNIESGLPVSRGRGGGWVINAEKCTCPYLADILLPHIHNMVHVHTKSNTSCMPVFWHMSTVNSSHTPSVLHNPHAFNKPYRSNCA